MTARDLTASSDEADDGSEGWTGTGRRGRRGLIGIVVLVGIVATTTASWLAWRDNQDATQNILRVQTRQAGEVLVASIPGVVHPLDTAGQLASSAHDPGSAFRSYMRAYIGPVQIEDASLWSISSGRLTSIASLGPAPDVSVGSAAAVGLARDAPSCSASFAVREVHGAGMSRFAYACSVKASSDGYVVYAERPLPKNRHAQVASNSAFSELRYAIYFGRSTRTGHLVATDFPTLPPSGMTSRIAVPFGTAWLTLVAGPNGSLAGSLSNDGPWFVAVFGLLFTLAAGVMTRSLVRGRERAEVVAAETKSLNLEVGKLLADQQVIALTLQRSLLPLRTPPIAGVAVASKYVPGSEGLEVGGDWYSIVNIDDDRFGFVVGDVSGHSVQAASVMAALRFTIRTLILEGHAPAVVLNRCSRQVTDLMRGHLATVIVCVADQRTRSVAVANAGHLSPLLVTNGDATYVETRVGVPLGVTHSPYEQSSFVMPPGSTLLTFTDGLVERRGEGLDAGLERLRLLAVGERDRSDVDAYLTSIVDALRGDHRLDDDLAVLAVRWP